MESKPIIFNSVEKIDTTEEHIPSVIQADTLFTFTSDLKYMLEWLQNLKLYARYNIEYIEYLNLEKYRRIAYPMKCFCDINLHKLENHIGSYGHCGLAFSKEWGMQNGVQPVHYINKFSNLAKDISFVINHLFNEFENGEIETSEELSNFKNYVIHQLMYCKPYSGRASDEQIKCFTDECEWRFIPNVTHIDKLPQIIFRETELKDSYLNLLSSLLKSQNVALPFEAEDIKYIIIEKEDDFSQTTEVINNLKLSKIEKLKLISKIIVWNVSKGDF